MIKKMYDCFAKYAILMLVVAVVFSMRAFGADGDLPPATLDEFFNSLVALITSIKGAAPLVVALGVTQLVMLLARTKIGDLAGKWKLLIVSGLTIVITILGFMAQGTTFAAALFSGATLAAVQVFVHQLITQLSEKPKA